MEKYIYDSVIAFVLVVSFFFAFYDLFKKIIIFT